MIPEARDSWGRSPLPATILLLVCLSFHSGCDSTQASSGSTPSDPRFFPARPMLFEIAVPAAGELRAVQTTPVTVPPVPINGMTLSRILEQGAFVKEGDVVAEFDPSDAERTYNQEAADYEEAKLKIVKNDAGTSLRQSMLEADSATAEANLETATTVVRGLDPRISPEHQRIEAELGEDLAEIKLKLEKERLTTQGSLGQADRDILVIAESRTKQELEIAKKTLDAMKVKAPHDGIVVYKTRWGGEVQVGDTFWPGQSLGEIPDLSSFEVKGHVLETDGAAIEEGQKAEVRFDALPGLVLEGEVKTLSPVATTLPRSRSPVKYFEIIVSLPNQDASILRLGMKCSLQIQAKSMEDAIVVPRFGVREDSGRNYVYVMNEGQPQRKSVKIGPGSRERVSILEGVAAGDIIHLGKLDVGEDAGPQEGESES